ncbi:DUF1989 domain-containing protein, partial [Pseudomonas sp. MAFF 311095]
MYSTNSPCARARPTATPSPKGQYIQVLDVAGRQCSDFVALDRRALDRGVELDLDQTVTRTLNGSAYPAPG